MGRRGRLSYNTRYAVCIVYNSDACGRPSAPPPLPRDAWHAPLVLASTGEGERLRPFFSLSFSPLVVEGTCYCPSWWSVFEAMSSRAHRIGNCPRSWWVVTLEERLALDDHLPPLRPLPPPLGADGRTKGKREDQCKGLCSKAPLDINKVSSASELE